ncbi:hypothetical protein WN48_11317 [Eufriesea mexicana]|uniref:Uncharacterized protein n=1 Tax=Eufriesea mexicana TaxID=516756 RepID=A0A310SM34_9HYME|nr:hypothetical protein WN48_11317 [Eufriesea mexicana]
MEKATTVAATVIHDDGRATGKNGARSGRSGASGPEVVEERRRCWEPRFGTAVADDADYDGDRSCASLPRLSVGEGVALRDGDGESDGPTGVEDFGAVAV